MGITYGSCVSLSRTRKQFPKFQTNPCPRGVTREVLYRCDTPLAILHDLKRRIVQAGDRAEVQDIYYGHQVRGVEETCKVARYIKSCNSLFIFCMLSLSLYKGHDKPMSEPTTYTFQSERRRTGIFSPTSGASQARSQGNSSGRCDLMNFSFLIPIPRIGINKLVARSSFFFFLSGSV